MVGEANDRCEQEADRLADRILDPALGATLTRGCVAPHAETGSQTLRRQTDPHAAEDEERDEDETIRMKPVGGRDGEITPAVEGAVESGAGGGQPLPDGARALFEARFGHDFSQVRVHTDARAAAAARDLRAQAFTHGQDVYFGAGHYRPHHCAGGWLLAHELAHTLQDRPGLVARRTLDAEPGSEAAAVAPSGRQWRSRPMHECAACARGSGSHDLCPKCRQNSILQRKASDRLPSAAAPAVVGEALRATGRPLEPAIRGSLEARFRSDFSEVRVHTDAAARRSARAVGARAYTVGHHIVFGQGAFAPATISGRRLLAHEITHVLQQGSARAPQAAVAARSSDPAELEADRVAAAVESSWSTCPSIQVARAPQIQRQNDPCEIDAPQACPTYELWLQEFRSLPTFEAESGHEVLGDVAASQRAGAPQAEQPVPPVGERPTDRFIDHPTDRWVQANLPPNLRETAYRLPSDCADIAVILRHVWLAGQRRSETHSGRNAQGRRRNWVIGDRAGGAARERIATVIRSAFTGNLQRIVAPYTDESGQPLRSFPALQNLLHPGDVLVWEHQDERGRRTGGHSHTIESVTRNGAGDVVRLTLLQGNLPISQAQARAIRRQERQAGRRAPSEEALRGAPGRRIERDEMTPRNDLRDLNGVWTWADGSTVLIVAGPPAAAARPAPRRRGRRRATRALRDWLGAIRSVTLETLQGVLEATLLEARAMLEAGRPVRDAEAEEVGEAIGQRLWMLARQARDLGSESHFQPLRRMRTTLRALRDAATSAVVAPVFNLIDRTMMLAARGISGIDFRRPLRRAINRVNVLLTGFDPFEPSGSLRPPGPEQWNPSGAAVLALDDQTLPAGRNVRAAVEGIVLPVSFREFRTGLVERAIGAHINDLDAVVTVSMHPRIDPTEPVAIERFAVGTHLLTSGRLEAIPTAAGVSTGPAIIETTAPVDEIAATRALRRNAPTIRNNLTLRFGDARIASNATRDIGGATQSGPDVVVSDPAAIRGIIQTMQQPDPNRAHRIRFRAGGRSYEATVVSGPGGNFLSNEVSYRVLRQLAQVSGASPPVSFHVHTQRGDPVPQARGRARAAALGGARRVRQKLISSLKDIVMALARRIAAGSGRGGQTQ